MSWDDDDDPRFSADGEMEEGTGEVMVEEEDRSDSDSSSAEDDSLEILLGDDAQQAGRYPTPCGFVTGSAGTGKTALIRQRIEDNPTYAIASSSTGVSAVNIGATTINSLLGFFDTDSLRDAFLRGSAQRKLRGLLDEGYENVALDECSMIPKETLDLLVRVFDDVNEGRAAGTSAIGLILLGDPCQLSPIPKKIPGARRGHSAPVPWFFESDSWFRFAENTTKLTKIWRQDNPTFLAALNHARSGQGEPAVSALRAAGTDFADRVDMEFDGTTIVATNVEADRINDDALIRVAGRHVLLPSRRWGKPREEWGHIPEKTMLREGAYVMLLANQRNGRDLLYVNGDCGHVLGVQPSTGSGPPTVMVKLVRNGMEVAVGPLVRHVDYRDKPDGFHSSMTVPSSEDTGKYIPKPHYRGKERRWVAGQLEYYPIRLAYSSTCHKVQGLTLDRCQVDMRAWNWSKPSMAYVACSRSRTPQGLRLVGMPEKIAKCFACDPKVRPWL